MDASKMNYDELLEFALSLAVNIQQSGAETYRVEETITRLLSAYGIEADASVIPSTAPSEEKPTFTPVKNRTRPTYV